MTDPNAVPTIAEELERKVLDELVRLAHCLAEGHMTEGEYALIAKSVWTVVSGLIPLDSLELVAVAANQYQTPNRKAVFFKDGDVYRFAWHPDQDNALFTKRGLSYAKPEQSAIKVDRLDRRARLETLFAALQKAGWVRLA